MTITIPRVAADNTTAQELVDHLVVTGCVVVEGIIDPVWLGELRQQIDPLRQQSPFGSDDFSGHKTTRTGGLVRRSEAVRRLVSHELVTDAVSTMFGNESMTLNHAQLIAVGPGETGQDLHRDQWVFGWYPFAPGYEVQVNTMWALSDFTEESGATVIVPGSHHEPPRTSVVTGADPGTVDYSAYLDANALPFLVQDGIPAEMPAGSLLLYTGSLYHGGGTNSSEDIRWGLSSGYVRAWLRQEENYFLPFSPAEIAELDDDFLRLLGYARTAYAHGWVEDMRDPLDFARGIDGHHGFGDPEKAPLELKTK